MYGHIESDCRKKSQSTLVWREVNKGRDTSQNDRQQHIQEQEQQDGFIMQKHTKLETFQEEYSKAKTLFKHSWNIRGGLNWPNKQVDMRFFLQNNNIGFMGLLETKIKASNMDQVLEKTDQLIHNKVLQLSSQRQLYITMVYGHNNMNMRQSLWSDIRRLAREQQIQHGAYLGTSMQS
ncbi:hypothetical protein Cgig2_010793 [Carnegiea gigantea]|uniref:Uncharacterized protein n=1 Tax=Carnegiea gigantea TaxID=171969 RepID=A0A9Q1GMI9_9CARY|nr:hypothetical protein Cgig2_010793 [Carnegiea gigantea]